MAAGLFDDAGDSAPSTIAKTVEAEDDFIYPTTNTEAQELKAEDLERMLADEKSEHNLTKDNLQKVQTELKEVTAQHDEIKSQLKDNNEELLQSHIELDKAQTTLTETWQKL